MLRQPAEIEHQQQPIKTFNTTTTETHYAKHSDNHSYEKAFFYDASQAYMQDLADKVVQRLGLDVEPTRTSNNNKEDLVLLDIGGGTGNFTREILSRSHCHRLRKAVVVDPYLSSVVENDSVNNHGGELHCQLQFVKSSADQFADGENAWWKQGYDVVLMKEVIHHLDDTQRLPILRGIYNGLLSDSSKDNIDDNAKRPCLLIVTRPQIDIDYPLWDKAQRVWAQNQPSSQELQDDLQKAGFVNIQTTTEVYPCSIPLVTWQGMIRQRFWSTFAHFADDELDRAARSMAVLQKERLDEDGNVQFEDRLVFLSASKA